MGEPGSPGGANAAFSVDAVWGRVVQTLGAQWQEWQRLCEMCYGSDVALALTADQVMSLMDEQASKTAKAAANAAAANANTAHVVTASRAASTWRKNTQKSDLAATEESGSENSRMSV